MDILITDSMLREFLETDATPAKIAECVSLCGPSIERVTKENSEVVYHVEATTNRVDAANAYGLAREAATILPEFKIKAKLKPLSNLNIGEGDNLKLKIKIDKKLCSRFMAVKLSSVSIGESPSFIKERLQAVSQRPINNAIDITNYVMFMLGIPLHAFDYDALGGTINVREAKKGEVFVTLDNKSHKALGGEVVFDNGSVITDLPGVMGAKNTAVTSKTKNILLVSEHVDALKIRQASLKHEIRTMAASINEKDPDPNNMPLAIAYAVELFKKHAKANVDSKVFDSYLSIREETTVTTTKSQLKDILGIEIGSAEINRILVSLGFKVKIDDKQISVTVPTWRVNDIQIPEDIAEEIARIYGYFRFPSILPSGELTSESRDPKFDFENKIKTLLSGFGGIEVYTLSLVSREMINGDAALKLKNPLGGDGEYMRTSLTPSLLLSAKDNKQQKDSFHLFELSNVYLPKKGSLPTEEIRLAGLFGNTDYRHAKGVLEALFEVLNIKGEPVLTKNKEYFTYEFQVEDLYKKATPYRKYKEISKFPPQIEDITFKLNINAKVGDLIKELQTSSKFVNEVELKDIYENNFTVRVYYMHPEKTLTDEEVAEIRKTITSNLNPNLFELQSE